MPIPNTRSFTFDYPGAVSAVKTRVQVTQHWDPALPGIVLGKNIDLVNANPALNEYIANGIRAQRKHSFRKELLMI